MVALLGFLDAGEVGLEVFLARPGSAVDALEHLVLRVAAPVGARDLHELEDLELAGRRHVRPAAEVGESALRVERDILLGRDRRDDLGLVMLALRLEERDGIVARHHLAGDGLVLLRELGHLLLDGFEVLGRERPLEREIVVEAVLDHGSDRDLCLGKELLHRVGEQVRGRMPQHVEARGVLGGDDGERRIVLDAVGRVDDLAVDGACQRGLGKARSDRGGDVGDGNGRGKFLDGAVGQSDPGHGSLQKQKSAGEPHFSGHRRRAISRSLSGFPTRSRCHNHAFPSGGALRWSEDEW